MVDFIRYQSAVPNARGYFPGVFALANGLAREKVLSGSDAAWLRIANVEANRAYADPSCTSPDCFDPVRNPGARSWFRSDAVELLRMTSAYLSLLDRYRVPWVELRTSSPGRIVYQDGSQIVAVPYVYPDDWPFGPAAS